jgi:hypothetical protein
MSEAFKIGTANINFLGKFAKEIFKGMEDPDSAFNYDMDFVEEGAFTNWVTTEYANSMNEAGVGIPTVEQTNRIKTAGFNFLNSMTSEQQKGFLKLSDEERNEKFETYLDLMPKISIEEFKDVYMDKDTKQDMTDLVKANKYSNARVTIKSTSDNKGYDDDVKIAGLGDQPTMAELVAAGFDVKDSFVYQSGAAHPGERLGITLEDDNGNMITVATKGALVLGEGNSRFIPSEESNYISDYLKQAEYNYEHGTYKIPLNYGAFHQLTDRTQINNSAYTPGTPHIETNVGKDGYSIELKSATGQSLSTLNFSSEGGRGKKAYDTYREALDYISGEDIFGNPNLTIEKKVDALYEFMGGNPLAQE